MGSLVAHRRRVALVCLLSPDARSVLLQHGAGHAVWQPIRLLVNRSSHAAVVHRWQRVAGVRCGVREGRTVGRMTIFTAETDRITQCTLRIFVYRAMGAAPASAFGSRAAWWALDDVAQLGHWVFPRELGPFLQGYVEGWIPDGWITLDC